MSMFLKLCHAADPPLNCTIVLKQSEKYVYSAGDRVEGTLIVSHQKDFVTHGFKVALEGNTMTKFKEGDILQTKSDNFLNVFEYAYGGKVDGSVPQRYRLAGGPTPHRYPFKLTMPTEPLPQSFKSSFGLIHYQVVVYMHMPTDRFVKKAEKALSMGGYCPLQDSMLSPVNLEKGRVGTVTCQQVSDLKFTATLPQSGYLPGQAIPFEVGLDSTEYEIEVESMVISLVQKIGYKAGNLSRILKTMTTVIATLEKTELDSQEMMWADSLAIPTGQMPSSQKTIISIQYIIKVDVNTKQSKANLRGEIPIAICTPENAQDCRSPRSSRGSK